MRRLLVLLILVSWLGCSLQEEMPSFDPGLELLFSRDSLHFDTLLSENRSITQRLTVYNPNAAAVQLTHISLGKGKASDYSVIINGRATTSLMNERLLGGDSLLILVEVTIRERGEDRPYAVKDSLIFEWNTNVSDVKLIAYGQDGHRLGKESICSEIWTNDRPYIITDTLLVGAGCHLTIEKGTKIYFQYDAILFVQGSLTALGDAADHIEFRNARFDGVYDSVPGQWGGIYFLEGSSGNALTFTDIFNGKIGLRIGTPDDDDLPDVSIAHSKIFNMSVAGILAFTSDVDAVNTLIYNCGLYSAGHFAGGNYSYRHCTIANEPSLFIQEAPSVQFSDHIIVDNGQFITDDLAIELINTIIWGTREEELLINTAGGANITTDLRSNIIKSGADISGNFTSSAFNFPGFKEVFSYDYSLDTLAFAKDKAIATDIATDITGALRSTPPDIGAYERIE